MIYNDFELEAELETLNRLREEHCVLMLEHEALVKEFKSLAKQHIQIRDIKQPSMPILMSILNPNKQAVN